MHILHYPCHTFITGNWESRILILSDRRVVWTSLTAPPRQVMGDVLAGIQNQGKRSAEKPAGGLWEAPVLEFLNNLWGLGTE